MSNRIAQLPWTLRQPGVSKERVDRWLAFVNDPSDARHGTANGYGNLGCRCNKCRAANVERTRDGRAQRSSRIPEDRHGRWTTYLNYSCRCNLCTEANRLRHDVDPTNYSDRAST